MGLFESPYITVMNFCLCGWMKSAVHKTEVDTPDELLAGISDAAGCIKKREDKLGRTSRDLHTELRSAVRLAVRFSNIYC